MLDIWKLSAENNTLHMAYVNYNYKMSSPQFSNQYFIQNSLMAKINIFNGITKRHLFPRKVNI